LVEFELTLPPLPTLGGGGGRGGGAAALIDDRFATISFAIWLIADIDEAAAVSFVTFVV
jgi:hypothetical protein